MVTVNQEVVNVNVSKHMYCSSAAYSIWSIKCLYITVWCCALKAELQRTVGQSKTSLSISS